METEESKGHSRSSSEEERSWQLAGFAFDHAQRIVNVPEGELQSFRQLARRLKNRARVLLPHLERIKSNAQLRMAVAEKLSPLTTHLFDVHNLIQNLRTKTSLSTFVHDFGGSLTKRFADLIAALDEDCDDILSLVHATTFDLAAAAATAASPERTHRPAPTADSFVFGNELEEDDEDAIEDEVAEIIAKIELLTSGTQSQAEITETEVLIEEIKELRERLSVRAQEGHTDAGRMIPLIDAVLRGWRAGGASGATREAQEYERVQANDKINMLLKTGDEVDVGDQIGQGRSGLVYLGTLRTARQTKIAIKVLRRKETEAERREVIKREILIQANLDSQYVVRVWGVTENFDLFSDGTPQTCALLEYADYGSLFDFLETCKGESICKTRDGTNIADLSRQLALQLMYEISLGVEFIHGKGFTHGDICPRNILLFRNFIPKLADFGSAHEHGAAEASFERGMGIGHEGFIAPELLEPDPRKRAKPNPRTDTYSMGATFRVVCHKMFAKRAVQQPPSSGGIDQENSDLPDDTITRELDKIIIKCTDPDPENRFGRQTLVSQFCSRNLFGLLVKDGGMPRDHARRAVRKKFWDVCDVAKRNCMELHKQREEGGFFRRPSLENLGGEGPEAARALRNQNVLMEELSQKLERKGVPQREAVTIAAKMVENCVYSIRDIARLFLRDPNRTRATCKRLGIGVGVRIVLQPHITEEQAFLRTEVARAFDRLYNGARDDDISDIMHGIEAASEDPEFSIIDLLDRTDEEYRTPLYIAAKLGNKHAVMVLVAFGADVNKGKRSGKTPLHVATQYGRTFVMKWLIDNGAEVNATTDEGKTPLHDAAKYNRDAAAAQVLLDHDAIKDCRDAEGNLPADHARTEEIRSLLMPPHLAARPVFRTSRSMSAASSGESKDSADGDMHRTQSVDRELNRGRSNLLASSSGASLQSSSSSLVPEAAGPAQGDGALTEASSRSATQAPVHRLAGADQGVRRVQAMRRGSSSSSHTRSRGA